MRPGAESFRDRREPFWDRAAPIRLRIDRFWDSQHPIWTLSAVVWTLSGMVEVMGGLKWTTRDPRSVPAIAGQVFVGTGYPRETSKYYLLRPKCLRPLFLQVMAGPGSTLQLNASKRSSSLSWLRSLKFTVLRLRSDLKLAAAELQAKDARIKAQNVMIDVLNGEILVNSVREITPKPEDKEDVVPGIVALSTYKEKGLEINLGEIFRSVKKFFTED